MTDEPRTPDPWGALRAFTAARIAIGRAGSAQPTSVQLDFQLAHARARDAVHAELDFDALAGELPGAIRVHSAAPDRRTFLMRPDLGRRLDEVSRGLLTKPAGDPWDLACVIGDGLSARAAQAHAAPLVGQLLPPLRQAGLRVAPPVLARQARVALGDEIGERLGARLVVVLLGERPGLSAADALGAYLTYGPRLGRTDAERNCVSNIRPEGLDLPTAAHRLDFLIRAALRLGFTGVSLKEEAGLPRLES